MSATTPAAGAVLDRARFGADGLLPAIVQEAVTKDVLMLGYMDREALRRTLTEGRVTFWSRSRQEYWRKGDTSGHAQYVRAAAFDCDADTLLVTVEQVGAACHTGAHRCFDVDPLDPVTAHAPVGNVVADTRSGGTVHDDHAAPADDTVAPLAVAPDGESASRPTTEEGTR